MYNREPIVPYYVCTKQKKQEGDKGNLMSSKQKRAIMWIGTTVAMYLIIRYILPLVVPFLIAGIIARMLFPMVHWLHRKTKVSETIAIILVLGMAFLIGVFLIWFLGNRFLNQLLKFADQIPVYVEWIQNVIENLCNQTEKLMQLKQGSLVNQLQEVTGKMGILARDAIMQWVVDHWMTCVKFVIEVGAFLVIVFIAAVYWIKERHVVLKAKEQSAFRREINLIMSHTGRVGWAYVKVQGCIMVITTILCVVGLWLMKNPYSILLGVCIGILDVLPFFGTGTVFIPWIIISLFSGKFQQASFLAILYVICYFLREFMESKWLGNRIGITSLETMISMYVGLRLFGVAGLFTGPIAWILIKEIDKNIFLQ